jgi:hypothetical protein
MTNDLIPFQNINQPLIARSAKEIAAEFHIPYVWMYDLDQQSAYAGHFHSLRTPSAAVEYYLHAFRHGKVEDRPTRRDVWNGSLNLCVNLPDTIDFLRSDYMRALMSFLADGQRDPTDDEITFTVNTILNRPHQDGIDPRLWFIDYHDIIKELKPCVAVLDCVRRNMRDTADYAPVPAKFRAALLQATKTVDKLIANLNLLITKPQEGLKRIEEQIHFLTENNLDEELINELQSVLKLCYDKIDGRVQITRDSDARQDIPLEYFMEDAED